MKRPAVPAGKLLFLHVPKCGGATFYRILTRNFRRVYPPINGSLESIEQLRSLPRRELERYDAFGGHFFFGAHELFESPCTYVSFVRHPVPRVLSNYLYIFQSKAHVLHKFVCPEGRAPMPLLDFVASNLSGALENQVVLMLGNRGIRRPEFIERFALEVQEGKYPNFRIPFDDDGWSALLERARSNIETHFACVGLTERFDESLGVMRSLLPLADVSYAAVNVTIAKASDADLKAASEVILRRNRYDLALYEFCVRRLERQIEARKS